MASEPILHLFLVLPNILTLFRRFSAKSGTIAEENLVKIINKIKIMVKNPVLSVLRPYGISGLENSIYFFYDFTYDFGQIFFGFIS